MRQTTVLKKALFEEQKGVKILYIRGTPYEMGYQHGYLLADRIRSMVHTTLAATAAYVAAQTGSDTGRAKEMLWMGQKAAEPFLPVECREEMQGIADGVKAAGGDVTTEEILLWNTNYDQWCIYCHPHARLCDGKGEEPAPPSPTHAGSGGGCSSFCAWDDWAGGDGRLIFGKNMDNFNMPGQLDSRMMVVAAPAVGRGHVFMTYPGMIGLDGGVNEDGFEMMTQLNSMCHESMGGCGIAVSTRRLLTHAGTVDDTVAMLRGTPHCAGVAYHVADAKAKKAAVVETSSRRVCVRVPVPGVQALWQTNHSNCYPGWMGYSGYNMVRDQAPVNELRDVSTIERWQEGLRDPYNFYVPAPSRFERYAQLIHEHCGNITPERAMEILSDRLDPYTGKIRDKHAASWTNNILCTICALYPDFTFSAEEPLGAFQAHIANMWSLVAWPATGDLWLAIRDFPAQCGGYEHFNLKELLCRTK